MLDPLPRVKEVPGHLRMEGRTERNTVFQQFLQNAPIVLSAWKFVPKDGAQISLVF